METFFSTGIGFVIFAFLIIYCILWALVPFGIYAMQKRAHELTVINTQILGELEKLNSDLKRML
jgi:hypothetical protein